MLSDYFSCSCVFLKALFARALGNRTPVFGNVAVAGGSSERLTKPGALEISCEGAHVAHGLISRSSAPLGLSLHRTASIIIPGAAPKWRGRRTMVMVPWLLCSWTVPCSLFAFPHIC